MKLDHLYWVCDMRLVEVEEIRLWRKSACIVARDARGGEKLQRCGMRDGSVLFYLDGPRMLNI